MKLKRINREPKTDIDSNSGLIPTGSTLLNCALSDNPFGGYGVGKVTNIIGDSFSGKTLLALTCFAEVSRLRKFDEYALILGDVENSLEFDIGKLCGEKAKSRIIIDQVPDKIQDWYVDIWLLLKKEKPFIYVLDSLDSLTSDEDIKKIEEKVSNIKKREKGEKVGKEKGTYGTQKPKTLSDMLRTIKGKLRSTRSSIIIISQTRDNIGFGAMFTPKVRSGGKALGFYSTHEMWLAVIDRKKVRDREVGAYTQIKVTKNKLTGKRRDVEMLIYSDGYGVDDITCNIEFLLEEGYWKKEKQTILAKDLDFEGTQSKLISYIEENSLEHRLSEVVGIAWNNIEEDIRLDRKSRYE